MTGILILLGYLVYKAVLIILLITATRNLVFSNGKFYKQPIKTEISFYVKESLLIFVPFFGTVYFVLSIYSLYTEFIKYSDNTNGIIEVQDSKKNWLWSLTRLLKTKI